MVAGGKLNWWKTHGSSHQGRKGNSHLNHTKDADCKMNQAKNFQSSYFQHQFCVSLRLHVLPKHFHKFRNKSSSTHIFVAKMPILKFVLTNLTCRACYQRMKIFFYFIENNILNTPGNEYLSLKTTKGSGRNLFSSV